MEAVLAYLGTGQAATTTLAISEGMTTTSMVSTAASSGLWGTGGVFGLGQTLSTAATGLNLLGTLGAASASANAAEYNAKLAEQNAALAIADSERQAYYIKKNAEDEASQLRAKQRRAQSSRAAIVGASGLDMSGSPLAVMEGADYLGELDVQKILAGGTIAADNALLRGSRASSAQLAQASLDKSRAGSELMGGYMSAGSTLLKFGAKRAGYRSDSLSDFLM